MSKIKNIVIVLVIVGILVAVYFFYIKKSPNDAPALVSSSGASTTVDGTANIGGAPDDFLTLLLSIKDIKLDDSIFSDVAFNSLHDSSITLTPDGTEGRPNPFAQIGSDVTPPVSAPVNTTGSTTAPAASH